MFKFNALPKRWVSVTAPVFAYFFKVPCLMNNICAIARCIILMMSLQYLEYLPSNNLREMGKLNTH